jgi:hypothetical protein
MDEQNWVGWVFYGGVAVAIITQVISFVIGRRRTHAGLRLMPLDIIVTIGAVLVGLFANVKLGQVYLQFIHDAVASRSGAGQ